MYHVKMGVWWLINAPYVKKVEWIITVSRVEGVGRVINVSYVEGGCVGH